MARHELSTFENWWSKPNPAFEGGSPIATLWLRLSAKYLAAWARVFAADTEAERLAKRLAWEGEWAEGLQRADVTVRQVKLALHACNRRTDPPSLPEFIALALPVADVETALDEASRNMCAMQLGRPFVWSHPSIYWAAMDVGPDEIRTARWSTHKARWSKALAEQLKRSDWRAAPVYEPGKPPPGPRDRAADRQRVADLRAELERRAA
jgi:hypothetical protein